MTFVLASRCPRLALARDQRVAELIHQRSMRRAHMRQELELDRVVAHRELQLVRALSTGNAAYIRERERKLKAAQRRRARLVAPPS